jgi:hypothetical protein
LRAATFVPVSAVPRHLAAEDHGNLITVIK